MTNFLKLEKTYKAYQKIAKNCDIKMLKTLATKNYAVTYFCALQEAHWPLCLEKFESVHLNLGL